MTAISELINGQAVQGTYLIRNATVRTDRQGRDYLELTLSDQTGEISARLWECSTEQKETFVTGKVVGLTGRVQEWQGQRQLIVERIWIDEIVPPAQLVKGPPVAPAILWQDVISRVEQNRKKSQGGYFPPWGFFNLMKSCICFSRPCFSMYSFMASSTMLFLVFPVSAEM